VKIGGFGRSKFDDMDLATTMACASTVSLYQAPEMWGDEYTNAVDVYAFAMILFRIVTNHSPFPDVRGKPAAVRMQRVMDGRRAEIGSDIVPFVRSLIESCWAQNPEDRPSFAQIMDILNQNDFKIFPTVNSASVRQYIEEIRVKEQHT
jgi:serine/threonine protein kinase